MRMMLILALLTGLCAAARSKENVTISEGTITLPTYPWYDDPNPVFAALEKSIYYPYSKQDLISHEKTDRVYRTLVLENEFLKVTCIPELGGRIHSVLDKTRDEEMFHRNDEIKPALIAMRGAWISGGIEWNPGPQGHTVTIVDPVDVCAMEHPDGSASFVIGNTEKMFRTRWCVTLTLHPGKAYLDETIRLFNPTDGLHPYYFWNCTAFPSGPQTRFIYPMTLGTDHDGTTFFDWPINKGIDLSYLKNYNTMSSIFAYQCVFDFFGAYDAGRDRGIVSYANHREVRGKKAWTWGTDDFGLVSQMSLSDAGPEGAPYIEVQSGPLLTQADYGMLWHHREIAWREYWYPVHGLGDGFEYATRDITAQTIRDAASLEVRLLATGLFPEARCVLSKNGRVLLEQQADLSPTSPLSLILANPPEDRIRVQVFDAQGESLLDYETPLDIPQVERPNLEKKPARPDAQPTPDELYQKAFLLDSQSNYPAARKAYEDVLALDPKHARALCGLALLELETGRYAPAQERLQMAVDRDPDDGITWYLLGVAYLKQGAPVDALDCAYRAARAHKPVRAGYDLAGRASMRLGDYARAVLLFEQALAKSPGNTQTRNRFIAARCALHGNATIAEDLFNEARRSDPLDFTSRALAALYHLEAWDQLIDDWRQIYGEQEFTLLETVCFLMDLGLLSEAETLLRQASASQPARPMPLYYLAYLNHRLDRNKEAKKFLKQATALPCDFVFPSRVEDVAVLEYAATAQPKDAYATLLLGYLYAALDRLDEAVPLWDRTAARQPKFHTAWRLLGYHAWKIQKDSEKAEAYYRKAIKANPKDQIPYRDLAELLTAQDRRTEAIALIAAMPFEPVPRYDAVLWLAEAYLAEKRYNEGLELLLSMRFKNWEGASRPHDIFVAALMGRGKEHFEAERYDDALADFQTALTYPANLEVGARYELTDAETRYWLGKTFMTLGRPEEARAAWQTGAKQFAASHPDHPFIPVTPTQAEYVQRCTEALNESNDNIKDQVL